MGAKYQANPLVQRIAVERKALKSAELRFLIDRATPLLYLLVGLAGVVFAAFLSIHNDLDDQAIYFLGTICISLQVLLIDQYRQTKTWDLRVALHLGLSFAFIVLLYFLPNYSTAWGLHGIFHHSLFSAIFLLISGTGCMTRGLYFLLGAGPQAEDISRYPLILVPIALVVAVYLALISQLVIHGTQHFDWNFYTTPYTNLIFPVKTVIAGDWPKWSTELHQTMGIRNHILGTGLLMALTSLISLPIGVGSGVYLSEYAQGFLGNLIRFVITSLRSISFMILGFAAVSLVKLSSGTPLAFLFKGYHFDGFGWVENSGGTFFTASLVLSLVVIPIIARATEEGCLSLPVELREGSFALGCSEGLTLWRIVLPWALPNIITGALLGCAEAAGDTAILLFIAGRGDYGVAPFQQVTSLAYLIFDVWWGEPLFQQSFGQYQYTVGLILMLITVGLGLVALVLKNVMIKRHRGG